MVDAGIGISAVVAVGSKFIERSKFAARHDAIYDKEVDKSVRLAERFDKIEKEDVDQFEFQEYTLLHSKSLQDLRDYKSSQEEYKNMEWHKEPAQKYRSRAKVRKAKRNLQSSIVREAQHVDELETYSRSASSNSSTISYWSGSESGLDLARSLPYRTDSCSIRATGGSPPSASMEDICEDERKERIAITVSNWLSEVETAQENLSGDVEESEISCRFCHGTIKLSRYIRHMRSHEQSPYICCACGDQFKLGDLLSGHLNKCFYGNECSASSTLEMIISPIVPDITMNMDDSLRLYFIVNSKYLSSRYIQGGHTKLPRRYRTCDCCRSKKIRCRQLSPDTRCENCKFREIPCYFSFI